METKNDKDFVYLKLNDNYSNAFLTTNHGEVFYRDWQEQKRPEYVRVEKDRYHSSFELRECVRMGILKFKDYDPNKKKDEKIDKESNKDHNTPSNVVEDHENE